MEALVHSKEASVAALEREVRAKDKSLMERQAQMVVLLANLEGESGGEALRSAGSCTNRLPRSTKGQQALGMDSSRLSCNRYTSCLQMCLLVAPRN
jgi:hypothetical protein